MLSTKDHNRDPWNEKLQCTLNGNGFRVCVKRILGRATYKKMHVRFKYIGFVKKIGAAICKTL